jgi:retron-type reverse transcriptase
MHLYNRMICSGFVPHDFNTSVLIPIPKKGILKTPSDYRPISLSSVLSSILESLLLEKMPCITNLSTNQFGYKKNTSCKSAFMVANETIQYYKAGSSNVHVVSLDAAKAFDKLWRKGLFHKLKSKLDPAIWRLLYNYYAASIVMVSIDGFYSEKFQTTEGVKQGAVLSPFLFNFFMDDLLNGVVDLKLGAALGPYNSSILAYCDDLLLISSVESHMNSILDFCHNYACDWKLKFNAQKSVSYTLKKNNLSEFILGASLIPVSNGFIYLGLPIGDKSYV